MDRLPFAKPPRGMLRHAVISCRAQSVKRPLPTRNRRGNAKRLFHIHTLAARFCLASVMASGPHLEDSTPYEDRRAFPRVPVAMPAFLQASGERRAVHILDLSAGGAKLR